MFVCLNKGSSIKLLKNKSIDTVFINKHKFLTEMIESEEDFVLEGLFRKGFHKCKNGNYEFVLINKSQDMYEIPKVYSLEKIHLHLKKHNRVDTLYTFKGRHNESTQINSNVFLEEYGIYPISYRHIELN